MAVMMMQAMKCSGTHGCQSKPCGFVKVLWDLSNDFYRNK